MKLAPPIYKRARFRQPEHVVDATGLCWCYPRLEGCDGGYLIVHRVLN